jgi:protein phosphatase
LFARAPLFAVADGMGGARAGEVASRIAVEEFEPGLPDGASPEERLAEIARSANSRIHELSVSDDRRTGMGTTLTAAYVGENEVVLAHVGDSRAYRMRDGSLERLTSDHSLVGELVRRGSITEEEAEDHPQKSVITRALGPEPYVDVDTFTVPARAGDVFLLCSDGLTSMVQDQVIAEILRSTPALGQAAKKLIDAANDAGGRDNITVVLFSLEEVDGDGAAVEDQPTTVGEAAPSAEEVKAALALRDTEPGPPPAGATEASAEAPAPTAIPKRTAPLPRRQAPAEQPRRRLRHVRGVAGGLAALTIIALIAIGGWIGTRSVYFIGANDSGSVVVFRGLPYELPLGVKLYERFYDSGVPATELSARRRRSVLDHTLRSRSDASDLVRKIELGTLDR